MQILVTGGNRGLGLALVHRLCNEPNFNVNFTVRDIKQNSNLIDKLKNQYPQKNINMFELNLLSNDSIQNFLKQWNDKQLDILVNNAGFGADNVKRGGNPQYQDHVDTFQSNLFGLIDLTEGLLKNLKDNGKIISVSSFLAKLQFHDQVVKEKLSNKDLTKEQIIEISNDFLNQVKNNNLQNWALCEDEPSKSSSYYSSKCLMNCYHRFVLSKLMKNQQVCYLSDPGWCKTDMGGNNAPSSVEDGIETTMHLIQNVTDKNGSFWKDKQETEF